MQVEDKLSPEIVFLYQCSRPGIGSWPEVETGHIRIIATDRSTVRVCHRRSVTKRVLRAEPGAKNEVQIKMMGNVRINFGVNSTRSQ